jgi:hypothetical protein
MLKSARINWLVLLLWLVPFGAQAVDLFAAQKPVGDESAETRNAALSEMLQQVLVRVSGNPAIASQPAAADVLKAAPRLVQQYRYRSVEESGELVRYLWARFDQAGVERMLRERGLPLWTQRPEVLVWLAVEQSGQRKLLALDSEPAVREALVGRAAERGLPLQLPLMDLEDQAALLPADLWSDYQQNIRTASARYPHDRVLTGRLSARSDGRWQGAWTLMGPADTQRFESPALSPQETLRFAIDRTQELLAARYAPMPGGQAEEGVMVRFGGVTDLPRYAALLDLLQGLEPIQQKSLKFVDGGDLVFEFRLRGSEQNLLRALESSGRLVAEPLPPAPPVPLLPPPVPGETEGLEGSAEIAAPPPRFEPDVDYAFRLVN